jgi:MHS family proline/betaine transporter-like MFS transporter
MAIPTFLIGLLPGYATWGLWAPVALGLLRMVQGLSVGGEYTSSMVFLVERAPESRRGLMGALTACGAGAGTLLGSAVGTAFAASMSTAALESWGWRIPFLLGLIVGIAGYFLRRHLLETVSVERRKRAPIVETLHDHWRIVIGFAGLSVFHRRRRLCQLRLSRKLAPNRRRHSAVPRTRNQFIQYGGQPTCRNRAGLLSDRVGRKPLLMVACVLGFAGAVPIFWLLNQPSPLLAQFGQLGLAVIIGLYGGTLPAFLVEAAPPQVRCTAVSLGYNICLGTIGGLTPLVATWLIERTGDEIAPAFVIMASAAITAMTLMCFRETYRAPFARSYF